MNFKKLMSDLLKMKPPVDEKGEPMEMNVRVVIGGNGRPPKEVLEAFDQLIAEHGFHQAPSDDQPDDTIH